jgi:hypothetical protein
MGTPGVVRGAGGRAACSGDVVRLGGVRAATTNAARANAARTAAATVYRAQAGNRTECMAVLPFQGAWISLLPSQQKLAGCPGDVIIDRRCTLKRSASTPYPDRRSRRPPHLEGKRDPLGQPRRLGPEELAQAAKPWHPVSDDLDGGDNGDRQKRPGNPPERPPEQDTN